MSPKSRKTFLLFASAFLVLASFLFFISLASAVTEEDLGLNQVAKTIILPQQDIRLIVANIVRVILGLLGIISVVIILYGGFVWMTSGGEEEKINQAKKIMINWAIGLAIILLAFAIVTFIMRALGVEGLSGFGDQNLNKMGFGRGALGGGIIESHYPKRGALDVPRNTLIIVTFKEAIDDDTLMTNKIEIPKDGVIITTGTLISENVKIFANTEGETKAWGLNIEGNPNKDKVVKVSTTDHRTYTFDPLDWLGSESQKMYYSVRLGENIRKAKRPNGDLGDLAFPPGPNGFYLWDFEVGTYVDVTPPTVDNVFPVAASTEYMNAVVQINFSEAINPITILPGNIKIYQVSEDGQTHTLIEGNLSVANEYRTVEFVTNKLCGLNSCGEEIYCLPANANIQAVLRAATLASDFSPDVPALADTDLWDGVTDTAANSLNGNGENAADCQLDGLECPAAKPGDPPKGHCDCSIGPSEVLIGPYTFKDNYVWRFKTNGEIMSEPPLMEDYDPGTTFPDRNNVNIKDSVKALFNRRLMGRTLVSNGGNVTLTSDNPYVVDGQVVEYGGQPLKERDFLWFTINFGLEGTGVDTKCRVYIDHAPYQPTVDGLDAFIYSSQFTAAIKDIYQNCYKPSAGPGCETANRSCCTSATAYPSSGLCPQPLPINWQPGVCGNGSCESTYSENGGNCPADCSFNCGNGICATEFGENKNSCPDDCVF